MKSKTDTHERLSKARASKKPDHSIKKIGFVSRDYREKFSNGYRDFSHSIVMILNELDKKGCDTILFSLFSVVPRDEYDVKESFKNLKNINLILLEEFVDERSRKAIRYVVYYREKSLWKEYEFSQVFGSVTGMGSSDIMSFVLDEIPKRIMGNFCVLLCGETNGVSYKKVDKKIHDSFGLRSAIPPDIKIILNPIHDRMSRFEMKFKRRFLSENEKWVISVWNKGKEDINGKVKDGKRPAWTVFHNGKEIVVPIHVPSQKLGSGIEMGILSIA